MDSSLVELAISDFQKKAKERKDLKDIELFSKDFFFSSKYAKYRSQLAMFGGPFRHRSMLSLLIREGMTQMRRENIFSGDFDLGNLRTVPFDSCTYDRLADELFVDEEDAPGANDAFETIQKGVYQITGKKMSDHSKINKSTALKVVKTLSLLLRERQQSLMQLFKPPAPNKKFSMSFADSFPYEKNQDQVWLIADLKAYLSAELSDERFDEIGKTFEPLHDLMNIITCDVENILIGSYSKNYNSIILAYSDMIEVVENFSLRYEPVDLSLDEELFIHLHKLEFSHFIIGYEQLIREAIPKCDISVVFKELSSFTKIAFPEAIDVKDHHALLSIEQIPGFILDWHHEISVIVEKAINVNLTLHEIKKIKADVQNLLRNFYFFRFDDANPFQEKILKVSPWFVVAAICCVVYTYKSSSNFKPYWLGQQAQGGSIKASNKVSFWDIKGVTDPIPEEHRHIWINRLEYFADALRGQSALKKQRFALRSAIGFKMLDICRTNNTTWISRRLFSFIDTIKEHAVQRHQIPDYR